MIDKGESEGFTDLCLENLKGILDAGVAKGVP